MLGHDPERYEGFEALKVKSKGFRRLCVQFPRISPVLNADLSGLSGFCALKT